MKNFKSHHFVLILLLFIIQPSNAKTSSPAFSKQLVEIETIVSASKSNLTTIRVESLQNVISSELTFVSAEPVNFINRNLTSIYTICVILVLINLIAQIKIIYQMTDLFFQFRKKDELSNYSF